MGISIVRSIILTALIPLFLSACCCQPPDVEQLSGEYVGEWKLFYPTDALAAGDRNSAARFENFSEQNIARWLSFNEGLLFRISQNKKKNQLSLDDRADLKLLVRKINQEITQWKTEQLHIHSPSIYSSRISQAFTHLLARPIKERKKMRDAVLSRLEGVGKLCDSGISLLKDGPPLRSESAAAGLVKTAGFYESGFPSILENYFKSPGQRAMLTKSIGDTVGKIRKLSSHIRDKVIPSSTISDSLGKEAYNRKLRLYTGLKIHSLKLQNISLAEIDRVRSMIGELSTVSWKSQNPGKTNTPSSESCIQFRYRPTE